MFWLNSDMKCIGMKINLTDQLSNFGIIPDFLKVVVFIEEIIGLTVNGCAIIFKGVKKG